MIIGTPSRFAIESGITCAYERLGARALGYFVIHVGGRSYGVRSPDATLMACSIDEVSNRIAGRGTHVAPFAKEVDAEKIANSVYGALYGEHQCESYFDVPLAEFRDLVYSNELLWAPDGDEAFDDGSFVIQFDVDDRVRLIAFKLDDRRVIDPLAFRDEWLARNDYYQILETWRNAVENLLLAMPKTPEKK